MSHFHDRFKKHAVHKTLKKLRHSVDASDVKLDDSQQIANYARFRKVVTFAKKALDSVDPELVTQQALDQIQNALAKMEAHHQTFLQNKDANPLNQPADAFLNHLHLLPHNEFPEGERVLADQVEAFESSAGKMLDGLKAESERVGKEHEQLNQRVEQLGQQLTAFSTQFEQQKKRVDTLINEQTTQFAQRADDQTKKFNEQQGRFDGAETARTQQFDDRIAKYAEELRTSSNEATESVKKLVDEQGTTLTDAVSQHGLASTNALATLQERLDEATKIVGIIGSTGLTGNYKIVADQERKTANWLRAIALVCFLAMVGVVCYIVWNIGKDQFSWQVALFRLAVVLVVVAPAVYCSRESSRHRRIEQRTRRIELELVSLQPYLEALTEDERRAVITKLANQYFGGEATEGIEGAPAKLDLSRRDLLTIERLVKIFKP